MKADHFVTNKVLFQQSYGAHFRVILSLFPLINSFSQNISVLMHQVSISRNEVNIDINLLTTYFISSHLTFTFTNKFKAFLCFLYTLSTTSSIL